MRFAPLLLAPLLLVLLAACSASPSSPGTSDPSGRSTIRLDVAGTARIYELHHAARPASPAGYPVVFAFHGAGSTIASLARASGFDAMASRDGFAVVYPQGLGRRFDTRRGSADVAFVQAILADLQARLGIDRRRIYATGFSNGGFLSYRVAADLPGTFAAIAPVAGLMPSDALPARTTTSLLHVHGTDDAVVPAAGRGGSHGALAGAAAWAARAGCTQAARVTPLTEAKPLRVSRRDYPCPAGVQVSVLMIADTGHAWPQAAGGWLSRTIWASFR